MALFSISDLHLSFGTDKPMDVFGERRKNYEQRLMENWNSAVSADDVVIVNGDNSWAMYLEETEGAVAYTSEEEITVYLVEVTD